MRDAFFITFVLILISLLLGALYNLLQPFLSKWGVLEKQQQILAESIELNDGGVFVSRNYGRFWTQADDGKRLTKTNVKNIVFDPKDPNSVYAISSTGVYLSRSGGRVWDEIYQGVLLAGETFVSFVIDERNEERKYLLAQSAARGRILKSKGGSFYEVYSTLGEGDKVLGLWIDFYDTSTVFAGTNSGLLLESRDFGESWRLQKEFGSAVRSMTMLPSDTRQMYLALGDGRFFKTLDQGKSWQEISNIFRAFGEDTLVNMLVIDFHNENRFYAATNKGLLKSEDKGVSFALVDLLTALEQPAVTAIALDPNVPEVIYIGTNSQIQRSNDAGRSWQVKQLDTQRKVNIIKVKPDASEVIFVGVERDESQRKP